MKKLFPLLIFSLLGLTSTAQFGNIHTKVDTLLPFPDKMFAHIQTFNDSMLVEECDAFLYPVTLEVPKYKIFRNLFKSKISADSLVYNGMKTNYLVNGFHKTEIYFDGLLVDTKYYDNSSQEISQHEYYQNDRMRGPCGESSATYLIKGIRKPKNK